MNSHAPQHSVLPTDHDVRRIYATARLPLEHFTALSHPLNTCLGAQAASMRSVLRANLDTENNSRLIERDWEFDPAMMATDGFHTG